MRIVDRLILSLTRRSRKRERNLQATLPGLDPYDSPDAFALAHTGERGSLSLRSRRSVARVATTAAVAIVLPAAAFAGGIKYVEDHAAGQEVMQTEVYYQAQMAERIAASDSRDLCLAKAEVRAGGGYWAGAWAKVSGDPRLTARRAEQALQAAQVRSETDDEDSR